MKKLHILSLLVTISLFLPSTLSAAGFFKRVKGCALPTYKAKSILTGAGLTGFYGYQLYSHDQKWEEHESDIKKTCNQLNAYQKENQEKFRAILKSIIPQSEFEKLQINDPLNSFFRCKSEDYAAAHSTNTPYYNLIACPNANVDESYNWSIRHEYAHILHQDTSKRKESEQNYYQNILPAAALLTGYRIKDSISSSTKQVFKKNISSLGLFGMYALYNQYNANQMLIGKEREADRFAIEHTDSIKELQEAATDLDNDSWKKKEEIWEKKLKQAAKEIKNEEDPITILIQTGVLVLGSWIKTPLFYCLKSALFNEIFHDHPQAEERIAKIQEKIDLLKAQEAAADLEKTNS